MNSVGLLKVGCAAVVFGALAGCASNGGYTAYAGAQKSQIRTVAILAPMNPPSYTLNNQGSGAKMFGALGALADAAGDHAKRKNLHGLLQENGFDFSTAITNALKSKLEADGYQVSIVQVERKKPMTKIDKVPSHVAADAVLDVAVWTVGYANESVVDNDFRPDIKVDVNLVTANSRKLYSESIMYGYHNPFMSATDIDAPKDYYFENAEQLFGNPAKATEGLKKGVDLVSTHIASRLRGA